VHETQNSEFIRPLKTHLFRSFETVGVKESLFLVRYVQVLLNIQNIQVMITNSGIDRKN